MVTDKELENYLIYLNFIQNKLDKYFSSQSPFVFCKKGCAKCCHNQQFPYTQVEIINLINGLNSLPDDIRSEVKRNIEALLLKKQGKKAFKYNCPFLRNGACSVYNNRGLICRTFGLMFKSETGELSIPFCFRHGLNYSNVINIKTKQFSQRKYKKLNVPQEPKVYHVGYKQLADEDLAKGFGFRFGQVKPMIDWLEYYREMWL